MSRIFFVIIVYQKSQADNIQILCNFLSFAVRERSHMTSAAEGGEGVSKC